MPFLKPYPRYENPSGDGRNLVALDPLYYTAADGTEYRTRIGATTDGASTPSPVWGIIPPNGGPWFLPAEFHDACYRGCVEKKLPDGTWLWYSVPFDEANDLLNEAMEAQGVDTVRRLLIYGAVKHFGQAAYLADAAQPLPK